eukprot:271526-Pyramimonas_sp.AAC.1
MISTRMLVVALVLFAGVSLIDAGVGTKDTCHSYICKTDYGYFKKWSEWDEALQSCECVPYWGTGPCKVTSP